MKDNQDEREHISRLIKRARKKRGYSQESLAETIGVHRVTIARWETGHSRPGVAQVLLLKEALKLTCEDLGSAMWLVDVDLLQTPLQRLQDGTRTALRSFPFTELMAQAPLLSEPRLNELRRGAQPLALEVQYLRDCLGPKFQPSYPPAALEEEARDVHEDLIKRLNRLERIVRKMRRKKPPPSQEYCA